MASPCDWPDLGLLVWQVRTPDWRGNVGRRRGDGCDLVEGRLEQVVVAAIDDRYVGIDASPCRYRQTAEANAEDDDPRPMASRRSRDGRTIGRTLNRSVRRACDIAADGTEWRGQVPIIPAKAGTSRHH